MVNRYKALGLSLLLTLNCFGCAGSVLPQASAAGTSGGVAASWIVYWDWEAGYKEARFARLDGVSVFAASFDKKGGLRVPSQIDFTQLELLRQRNPKQVQYLSVVNDVHDGKRAALKDAQLLRRLLADKDAQERHAGELVELCAKHRFNGLEVDYENFWNDKALREAYISFLQLLRQQAQAAGLALRVILEPKALGYAAALPDGVDYVVMLYNLYGGHSGPGPKADAAFISKTCKRMEALPGRKSVAFANGGFHWGPDGKVAGITEEEAERLRCKRGLLARRDETSQALCYSFEDKGHHEVWYGDSVTLSFWHQEAAKAGYPVASNWRLGGNL